MFNLGTLGLFKSQKSLVAGPDNFYADFCRDINYIRAEQCLVAICLCFVLNFIVVVR